jgi:hypothetical protein
VEHESPGARDRLGVKEEEVKAHGDSFYWDSHGSPAHDKLETELESSSYVITYIATPAATHLPTLKLYYDLSDVVLIEKPLGAPPEEYREFLEGVSGGVEIVAADHYYFKLEVRLLQLLLTEERTLRNFLDTVEEIRIEILEEQPLVGAAADIGVIADLIPHAFAIISLLTPIDRIKLDPTSPLMVGRHEGLTGQRESYARMNASFPYQGRPVKLVIDVGKGADNAKWIKLSGERRAAGRSPSYKFDFGKGEAIDGTQATVRAAVRRIREPGVPDNAHLNMLRHVIEKRHGRATPLARGRLLMPPRNSPYSRRSARPAEHERSPQSRDREARSLLRRFRRRRIDAAGSARRWSVVRRHQDPFGVPPAHRRRGTSAGGPAPRTWLRVV